MKKTASFFHLHLVSDATGETLITAGRAVAAQHKSARAIEHIYPMIRTTTQIDEAVKEIDSEPGIVLYTFADPKLAQAMETRCQELNLPAANVLAPISQVFQTYLGKPSAVRIGAQHAMDDNYFERMEALNFTMTHDDGNLPSNIEEVDVIIIGISRTSKTPTSIYLAQRGIKAINIPIVPGVELSPSIKKAKHPFVVCLIATTERIVQIRQNRVLSFDAGLSDSDYIDRASIAEELASSRRLCRENNWPLIDVSRRSVEETAAEILALRAKSH